MKIKKAVSNPTAFLLLIFTAFAFYGSMFAQDTKRPRVIISGISRTPTPTPTPENENPKPAQTLGYLQGKISEILANPALRRGRVGVAVMSLDSGQIIYKRNAEKYFMPASNMKSYTIASAIDRLSLNFRFVTSVYSAAAPDSSGTIRGNLIIYGRGDPSISANFYEDEENYYRGIDMLAEKIAQAGVKRIEGDLIGDETYFNSPSIPHTWEWDDLQWYYGAEVSPLTINNNAIRLSILPTAAGEPASVSILPANKLYKIINKIQTVPSGSKREIRVTKKLAENVVEVSGKMPENDSGYKGNITVSRPARLFVELLKERLKIKGVSITGAAQAINTEERGGLRLQTEGLTEIAKLESPPLSLIAQKTMKPSQNLYTELILRAMGEELGDKTDQEKSSLRKGIEIVRSVLQKAGIAPESIVQYDASGLSRHNLITPESNVKLYRYMNAGPNSAAWRNSLTIGGVDGTLKRRFIGTSAESNVRGKTGTIDQVSALTGYVTSTSGEKFAFSVLTNNIPNSRLRVSTIDQIVVLLSDFDGKTN